MTAACRKAAVLFRPLIWTSVAGECSRSLTGVKHAASPLNCIACKRARTFIRQPLQLPRICRLEANAFALKPKN